MTAKVPESDALLPRSRPVPPQQGSHTTGWVIASTVSLGTSGVAGWRAVANFLASRRVDGGVFSLTTVVCAGACIYCIYQVVISLKPRTIEPILPSDNDLALRTNREMKQTLIKINERLIEMLPDEESQDIEQGNSEEQLYSSIDTNLGRLEKLLPEFAVELEKLSLKLNSAKSPQKRSLPSSPDVDESEDIMKQLDALARKVKKDISSRSSSTAPSAANSPYKEPPQEVDPSDQAVGGSSKKKRASFGDSKTTSVNDDQPPGDGQV